jgi:glycogen debranching enzyme
VHHVLHAGYTVLVATEDGGIESGGRGGLFDFDTRILSRYALTIDGLVPELVRSTVVANDTWISVARVALPGGSASGPRLPQDQITLMVRRELGRGMRETLEFRNQSALPWAGKLELALDADFADVQEAGGEREQRGRVDTSWDPNAQVLSYSYEAAVGGRVFSREMRVRAVTPPDAILSLENGRLTVAVDLAPRGHWSAELVFESRVDGVWRTPGDRPRTPATSPTTIESPNSLVVGVFRRAAEDLYSLRNHELDVSDDAWVLNAGVPTYTGLFGRDALTAGWQAALLGPEMMRGAIVRIAELQATADDPWRDAEPGKMVHEVRRGPLSELDIIPQRGYYGTQTTAAMFVLALSELWHWTGDLDFIARHKAAALRAMEWARRYGDRDGDGFLEYVQRSPRGLKNQGWKDSDEAIRYPDGSLVPNPIATIEEQAYHYLALQRMAELLLALGEEKSAGQALEEARRLRRRWQEAFWVEEDGAYAMALDPDKRPVRSIGSNPGHALAAGLVPRERARAVADRLLSPELFSGWGVRTLSTNHPSYNPFAYHLGTVWPVENATFVLGMRRYGLGAHADRLVTGFFDAARHFTDYRLPEAWSGDGPNETPVPIPYPRANSPQAWSASAAIQIVQMILGLYPFAPARLLAVVQPSLPDWLPSLTIRDVRVGDARVSLHFRRAADGSARPEVIDRSGTIHVVRVPPPDPADPEKLTWLDGLKDWLLQHAPGVTARQIRLALGRMDGQ